MKLLLRSITVFLWVFLGIQLASWIPPDEFVEVVGEIVEVDSSNDCYRVKINNRLVSVETNLPLPQPNKQIIILQPK
jgi:hypothetical protein